jgi:hypothetical protein
VSGVPIGLSSADAPPFSGVNPVWMFSRCGGSRRAPSTASRTWSGDDAAIHAAMRADELMEAGDMEGVTVWKMILKAIKELLAKERPEGEKVH